MTNYKTNRSNSHQVQRQKQQFLVPPVPPYTTDKAEGSQGQNDNLNKLRTKKDSTNQNITLQSPGEVTFNLGKEGQPCAHILI